MAELTTIPNIDIPHDEIAAFCEKWGVTELALFGSVLRDDFTPDSDVDVLVTFAPEATTTLFDITAMQEELSAIVGRPVEIVPKAGVLLDSNPFRRNAIIQSMREIYVRS